MPEFPDRRHGIRHRIVLEALRLADHKHMFFRRWRSRAGFGLAGMEQRSGKREWQRQYQTTSDESHKISSQYLGKIIRRHSRNIVQAPRDRLYSNSICLGILNVRMIYLLTAIHVIVCWSLTVIVLLQSGNAADLAGAFGGMGSQTVFGPRGSTTVMTKGRPLGLPVSSW